MSEVEIQEQDTERAERPVLHRTFDAALTAGDGRTIDVRVVPYGETALADDGHGGVPKGVVYREQFMPGVFAHQTNAANRVFVNFEHQKGLAGVVGHGLVLREAGDGFYGSFKLHDTPDGDKALALVNENVLRSISLEAAPVRNYRTKDGVVQRVKAHLVNIALCRSGAYKSAEVLAVREEVFIDEELLPVDLNPELVERCRKLGIELPQRYQAHPEDQGTPAEAGTPDESAPATPDNIETQE